MNLYIACGCDLNGAVDEGICDSNTDDENDAGKCHCKQNVHGRQCNVCKDGYWNLDTNNPEGCEQCTCNILGTYNNSGCNMHTGECTCKPLVTGKDCNQCLPETFGLSDSYDGCTPCDCDAGGSLDNNCDVITGQCQCRSHMTGRTCNLPKPNHFIPTLHNVYEAEIPQVTECISSSSYGVSQTHCFRKLTFHIRLFFSRIVQLYQKKIRMIVLLPGLHTPESMKEQNWNLLVFKFLVQCTTMLLFDIRHKVAATGKWLVSLSNVQMATITRERAPIHIHLMNKTSNLHCRSKLRA